jgi:predicted DNA binding protein
VTRRRALTDDQVRAIRAAHKPGVRGAGYRELARRFGVAESTVRDALTGRTAYAVAVEGVRELF